MDKLKWNKQSLRLIKLLKKINDYYHGLDFRWISSFKLIYSSLIYSPRPILRIHVPTLFFPSSETLILG